MKKKTYLLSRTAVENHVTKGSVKPMTAVGEETGADAVVIRPKNSEILSNAGGL